jgi:transcriptional regulator with XRE-family HTH domain
MKQMEIKRIDPLKLRKARENVGLTQAAAAARLCISRQRLNAYEQGNDRVFADMIVNMCELYGCGLDTFKKDELFCQNSNVVLDKA